MAGWTRHEGRAIHLPQDNVDTDQLIPARFMSTPRVQGYGDFLLHDMRRDEAGTLRPDFPLNGVEPASVLIAGRNFGTGSSREAAVYALVDAGFRAVIAPGFGDIFAANAINNGLLPARLEEREITALAGALGGGDAHVSIDLGNCEIHAAGQVFAFELDAMWREKLIRGWDDIDLTLQRAAQIRTYRESRVADMAWLLPDD